MDNRKTKAGTACEIARIDKDRFNEAVHAGHYPCAPATKAGATRLFDVDDLVALFLYGRLLEQATPPAVAGRIACRVRDLMHSYPDEPVMAIGWAENGMSFAAPAKHTDYAATSIAGTGSLSPLIFSTYYNVANIRQIVRKGIDEAELIVGND